jgi:hypothetical protein
MDLIEPGFRAKYENICVGNKGPDSQHIFFEGMLLADGLGMFVTNSTHCTQRAHERSRSRSALVWEFSLGTPEL